MKYQKGNFITVPNKNLLRGEGAIVFGVFAWLCSYSNEEGICYPSRSTLASDLAISLDSVDRALKRLEELGVLEKQARKDGSTNLSNIYQIRLVADINGQGSRSQRPGVAAHSGTELNPVLTKSNELTIVQEFPQKTKTTLEGFGEFWSAYPRKEDRATASAEWRKLSSEDRSEALKDVSRRKWGEPKFIPLAKTYLANRRWEDEPINPKKTTYVV